MRKTALDHVISRLAQSAEDTDPTVNPEPSSGAATAGPQVNVEGYIVTFLTRKSNPAINYAFKDGKDAPYTAENLKNYTYGQGDNFQWNSLICMFTVGGAKGAYVTDLSNDGEQGARVRVIGKTPIVNAVQFVAAVTDQNLPFPFKKPGNILDHTTLGNVYFVDVSNDLGALDTAKAGRYEGNEVLNMFDDTGHIHSTAIQGKNLEDFNKNYDNNFYRIHKSDGLHHVHGGLDELATKKIFEIMKPKAGAPAAEAPPSAAPGAPGAGKTDKVFDPQGAGRKASTQSTTNGEHGMEVKAEDAKPVDPEVVDKATKSVNALNTALGQTAEIMGVKASLKLSAHTMLLKSSQL